MSEPDFRFTFHFSNFQYPLMQDTGMKESKIEISYYIYIFKLFSKRFALEQARGGDKGLLKISHSLPIYREYIRSEYVSQKHFQIVGAKVIN